jgi:hypothetical protein
MICSGHAPITRERRVAAAHREEIEKHARVEGRRLAAHAFSVQRCHYAAAAGYDELAAAALASISAIAPPEDSCGCLKPSNTSTAANSPPPMSQVRRRTKKSVIGLHGKYRLVRTFTRAHVWMLGGSGAAPQAYRLKNPRPVSRFQLFVAAMCAAVIFIDLHGRLRRTGHGVRRAGPHCAAAHHPRRVWAGGLHRAGRHDDWRSRRRSPG